MDVIKQFLVSLDFAIDQSGLAKFNKGIASAAFRVTALVGSINTAAAGIFYGITKISDSFEKLGYELRLISPPITKVLQLRQEMMKAYSAAGIDIKKAAQQSILFNFSLEKTKFILDAIYKSVGLKFIPVLTKQMDTFRKNVYANLPKIQKTLEKFVQIIFKAFESTAILGMRAWGILTRLYEAFDKVNKLLDGWLLVIIAVIAAWKLLNLSFLASPIGLIITGLTALLALWDDYKTFQEGGQSLINWKAVEPAIKMISSLLKGLWDLIINIGTAINNALFSNDWSMIVDGLKAALGSVSAFVETLLGLFSSLGSAIALVAKGTQLGATLDHVKGFFGNSNVAANVAGNPAVNPIANPLGSSISNSLSNQSISQETNITVQGSADAGATGRAVSGEQSRVNFDMARNMKGAVR